jgi:hypothetical protein
MKRREFLTLGAGAVLAAELPVLAAKRAPLPPLRLETIEIPVGASKPFGAIQVMRYSSSSKACRNSSPDRATPCAARSLSTASWALCTLVK